MNARCRTLEEYVACGLPLQSIRVQVRGGISFYIHLENGKVSGTPPQGLRSFEEWDRLVREREAVNV